MVLELDLGKDKLVETVGIPETKDDAINTSLLPGDPARSNLPTQQNKITSASRSTDGHYCDGLDMKLKIVSSTQTNKALNTSYDLLDTGQVVHGKYHGTAVDIHL